MDRATRLLVVEDEPELATMLTDLLTGEGYAVELATDGQRGLHLGLTREFDLMLLDRGLPAIEGLDLLARLRARGRYVPTLVLSALGQPRDRVDGLDAGAEDYLGKPFEAAEEQGVVDTYVHYLRRKLHKGVIETVRGLGYRLGTR